MRPAVLFVRHFLLENQTAADAVQQQSDNDENEPQRDAKVTMKTTTDTWKQIINKTVTLEEGSEGGGQGHCLDTNSGGQEVQGVLQMKEFRTGLPGRSERFSQGDKLQQVTFWC